MDIIQPPKKFTNILIVFFLLLAISVLLCGVYKMGFDRGLEKASEIESESLDNYFTVVYENTMEEKGKQKIADILSQLNSTDSPQDTFELIAQWEIQNYTNLYWERPYFLNDDFDFFDIGISGQYAYDSNGNLRAKSKSKYFNNPYWIATQKTGACGELAGLFSDIANQSGFETRVIHGVRSTAGDKHDWVEIKLDNEWKFFDPTVYGCAHIDKNSQNLIFFGDRTEHPWTKDMEHITVIPTGEDLTEYYL